MRILYDYYRSTACYRVRIALYYKNVDFELKTVNLVKEGGEQHSAEYQSLNAQQLVPTFCDGDTVLTQSLAILEYLDEKYPEPAILPDDPILRARIRAFSQVIASDMHPLNNLRVLQYLTGPLEHSEDEKLAWYHHWLQLGFDALETYLSDEPETGFCFSEQLTMADICLLPQMYNAERFNFDMTAYPRLLAIGKHCYKLPSLQKAYPQ